MRILVHTKKNASNFLGKYDTLLFIRGKMKKLYPKFSFVSWFGTIYRMSNYLGIKDYGLCWIFDYDTVWSWVARVEYFNICELWMNDDMKYELHWVLSSIIWARSQRKYGSKSRREGKSKKRTLYFVQFPFRLSKKTKKKGKKKRDRSISVE